MSLYEWLTLGFIGQCIFSARFVIQWVCSERRHHSVIPMAFWYLSVVGGAVLLAYAVSQRDPVFIIGQTGGVIIYLRNIQLRLREPRSMEAGADGQ